MRKCFLLNVSLRCLLVSACSIESRVFESFTVTIIHHDSFEYNCTKLISEYRYTLVFRGSYRCQACMGSEAAVCCSVVEDEDTSGNVDDGSNRWILGSQGCPLPPTGDATLRTLSDPAVSASVAANFDKRPPSVDSENTDADDRQIVDANSSENKKSNKSIKFDEGSVKIKSEKIDSDDNSDADSSKEGES